MMGSTDQRALETPAMPLRHETDLDPLLDRIGEARIVCIGEASHGTHEYYSWRATITERLIRESGFDFVAVEGDWPDCVKLSHSIVAAPGAAADPEAALSAFLRWPAWMWANHEVLDFARRLRQENLARPVERRVAFYGLDLYSLWDSLRAVLGYLAENRPEDVPAALAAYRCFEPYAEDAQAYARALSLVPAGCEEEVVALLASLASERTGGDGAPSAPAFEAHQNLQAVVDAEAYYRAVVQGGPASWNIRDTHMADTLDRILEHHTQLAGRPAKGVVWEHNTHVGDARHTDMAEAGMVNLGQLVRERHGEDDCVLVGFGSHRGSVIAADEWGRPHRVMDVPPARQGSVERLLHESLADDAALFVFPSRLPDWAAEPADHRAIGVVYRPRLERWGNYVSTILGRRYDAFLWLDETTALRPLTAAEGRVEELESWPYGA